MHLQYFPPLALLTFFFLSIHALPLPKKCSLHGEMPALSAECRNNRILISSGRALQIDLLQPFVDAISSIASSDSDYDTTEQKPTTTSTCASSSDISKEYILNWLDDPAQKQWTQELLRWKKVSVVPRERLKVVWRAIVKGLGWAC